MLLSSAVGEPSLSDFGGLVLTKRRSVVGGPCQTRAMVTEPSKGPAVIELGRLAAEKWCCLLGLGPSTLVNARGAASLPRQTRAIEDTEPDCRESPGLGTHTDMAKLSGL